MKRYAILGMVLFSLILSVCHANEVYRDEYLMVRFSETGVTSAANAARQAVVNAAGGGTIEKLYPIVPGLGLVKLPAGQDVISAQTTFSAVAGVVYAEPDYKIYTAATPNDPDFSALWGLHNIGQTGGTADADIDAPAAWDLTTGDGSIIVAVTDTGVDYMHPDLADNMWVNTGEIPNNGIDDDNNGYIDDIYGYDFYWDVSSPMDDYGHGTHVSGTIGAVGNNGIGVAGVNWNVQIMACKIFFMGSGETIEAALSAAVEGIQYAVDNGAKVINASWGFQDYLTPEEVQSLRDVLLAAEAEDVLFVMSAGNEYSDVDAGNTSPQSFELPNLLSVLATDDTDQKAVFSNWGLVGVDLGAPGVGIYSCMPGSSYGYMDGTSMACPHVAGAAALIWSFAPDMTYAEVKDVLMSTADSIPALNGLCVTGARLNVHNAVLLLNPVDEEAPTPNPITWDIEPAATGLHQIVMKAVSATDESGVEYYFDCVEDDTYDSIQDERFYIRRIMLPGQLIHSVFWREINQRARMRRSGHRSFQQRHQRVWMICRLLRDRLLSGEPSRANIQSGVI